MFTAIYEFKVKKGCDEAFIIAWEELTKLIYQFEGSLGSRLHKVNVEFYIAYAQWPNRQTWENAGSKLPPNASEHRTKMKAACESIRTVYESEIKSDLLKQETC